MTQKSVTQEPVTQEPVTQELMDDDLEGDFEIVNELDISHLVIEDDAPVDNFQSEIQQRLLVEPLYSAQALPVPFLAAANVGLFYKLKGEPVVPDVMLSLGVQRAADLSERRNRSYFVWEFGKVPEVCVEVVSNREGDELKLSQKSRQKGKAVTKREIYSQIGVGYYVVFDPFRQIQGQDEMNGSLLRVWSIVASGYTELTPASGINSTEELAWLEAVGLGLRLWEGAFEEAVPRLWLRWCDRTGQVIPTGAEGQAMERQRADAEQQRADVERQRADAEQQRADAEQQRADAEQQRAERLAERLRALGIDPDINSDDV